jgi:predicted S18 family serine protease
LKDDIYELSEKEQELFTILMYKSGFYKETPINNKNIIKKLKERLQLVEGEIKAGNNNTDNFKELYEIIFKMTNLGVISLSAGRNYYKEIKKEYS